MKISQMLLWSSLCIPALASAQTISFQKQEMTKQKTTVLCDLIPDQCRNKPTWTLYKTAQKANQYYLMSNLKLYQLEQNKHSYKILNQWDFSQYTPQKVSTHWTTEDINTPSEQKFLYPALFKISEKTYAIAFIQSFHESYSGGGMNEEVADFFELIPQQKPKLMFQNIPFSVYRMIRACFSEQDYQKSGDGRCHDEENLVLNIAYLKPYTWQMQYHYSSVLSPASDQKAMDVRKNFILEKGKQEMIQIPKSWSAD